MLNPYPSAHCLFCTTVFGNSNLAPGHLKKHLKSQHPTHQNKSKAFFVASLESHWRQLSSFENSVVKEGNNDLVLASLKMAYILMQRKRLYTELKSVVLPCLEITADILHGGKKAVDKVTQIPLSDNTTKRRCLHISDDLMKELLDKLKKAQSFGIQLDETTDISDEVQLIVYCRFADEETKTIVEHYLCCLKVGVCATAQAILAKLNQFIEKNSLDWTKCKSLTTDGAAAMQSSTNGVVRKILNVSPDCVSTHCMIHREALVVKRSMQDNNQRSGLKVVVDDVIKIVNFIRSHSKKHRMFSELCKDIEADATKLIYHAEVRWLSRGKVLQRVFQLQQELRLFLAQQGHPMSTNFQDNFWLAKLSYLSAILQNTNRLNLSLQGKGCDVFEVACKVQAFKQKLRLWQSKVSKGDFSDFECLQNFFQTSNWETEDADLE